MNAVEFEAVLERLGQIMTIIQSIVDGRAGGCELSHVHVESLFGIYRELDKHRLEMQEARKAASKCGNCKTALHGNGQLLCPMCYEAPPEELAEHRRLAKSSRIKTGASERLDEIERIAGEHAATDTLAMAIADHDGLLKRLADTPDTNQTEPINWDRWHDLLDIKDERELTPTEAVEYLQFAKSAKQLDAVHGMAADAALDGLAKGHERVIDSIRRLTAAVRAGIEQDGAEPKSSPIEVEMRQHTDELKIARWECWLAGQWIRSFHTYTTTRTVQIAGNSWLADLSKQVGVSLIAKWEGEKVTAAAHAEARARANRLA